MIEISELSMLMLHDAEKEEIASIRARLASLDAERTELGERLAALERRRETLIRIDHSPPLAANSPTITAASSTTDKVTLFRRLFVGRQDVFPVRWENRKTGRSGYAPACANEWVRGICGKPQLKCGECPHHHLGRPLPVWQGCRLITAGEVFLMNRQSPDSLDGRYFGPLPTTTIVGRADPLWTHEKD